MKEDNFPHTRKPLHLWRWRVGGGGSFRAMEESTAIGVQRAKHRGSFPTSTHQPERLVGSPTGMGGDWELKLGLQRSDPRERTGLGCMNTA